jgi:two-component system, NtrC family, response regulator HydG
VEHAARILVVDDDPVINALVKATLEQDGHAVITVTSSNEAVQWVVRDDFDVVLTDLAMPELTGIELCERVLGARPDTAVILVTGHATMQAAVASMRVGAYDFVTKPVDPVDLRIAVARAVQKRHLQGEVRRLERVIAAGTTTSVFGTSVAMRRVQELVTRIAASDASVLIGGETGTGKELVARAIHEASGGTGPFVALNCAAVPANLLESELFGHARGAYTDAHTQRRGLFVEANGGTIFLDEVADLPLEIQPKLLRTLQERKVRPIGSNAEVSFNARIITATNRDLEEEVAEKRFREDLYYRLNVISMVVPALRERGGDVVELAVQFLADIAKRKGKPTLRLSHEVAQKLLAYAWPGNVRELENCIERAVVVARFDEIVIEDLPEKVRAYQPQQFIVAANDATEIVPMAEVERRYVLRTLALCNGNKVRAAQALGWDRKTLYRKLVRFGIPLEAFRPASKPPPAAAS